MNNKEIRSFEIRSSESRHISGYSVVFNSMSENLGGFREIIAPTAITNELINRSDVVMNYQHDDSLILARSRNGEGTLTLRLDEHGLLFEFDMPNSDLGDRVLESIRRGDITKCSFAFSLPDNDTCEIWEKTDDGQIIRTITEIDGLYDCAIVCHPAYNGTEISARSLEMINKLNNDNMTEEHIENRNDEQEKPVDEEKKQETQNEEETQEEQKTGDCEETKPEDENRSDDENDNQEETQEENTSDENPDDENDETNKTSDEEKTEEKENKNIEKTKSMEKRNFSLLKAIRTIANGQKLDEATQAVVNMGAEDLRNAGIAMNGQIQIPVGSNEEERAAITVTAEGNDVVVTDFLDILAPLHDNLTLVNAGSRYLTGLVGDVQIPSMTAENVTWVGEVATAQDGAGSFDSIKLSPKRLSAVIQISKQFLVQDSLSAENLIRNELVNAIALKLQSTILGTAAGTTNQPAGLAYNVTPTEVSDFKGICAVESALEAGNFWGEKSYILSSGAKAALRSMIKGQNGTGMVMSDNEVDGVSAQVCNAVATDCYFVGDWSQLVIAQFGGIDLTVDPYTLSADGKIRLVINAFFDAKLQRAGAIKYAKVVEPEEGE